MGNDNKNTKDTFKLELPSDDSATKKPKAFSEDHDPERDLGKYHDEPDALFSVSKDLKNAHLEKELKDQLDWLQHQVKGITNLKDGDKLTTDQTEILKRYIALKESEVRDLRDQHDHYKSFVAKLGQELEKANLRIRGLLTDMETMRAEEQSARKELRTLKAEKEEAVLRLTSDFESRLKRAGQYESQVEDLIKKRDQWRERIKEELKRIKLKERELENRYELLKRDMQALLDSKDKHSLELKKKNDALELEMESLEEKLVSSSRRISSVESKKRRLVETMRLALTLLESIDKDDLTRDEPEMSEEPAPGFPSGDDGDDPSRKVG